MRSHGSLQGVVGAESSFAEAAVADLGPGYDSRPDFGPDFGLDFLEIQNVGGIRVVLSTQSLFLVVCNCSYDDHSPCGTRSTWCCLLWRGLISSESAISGTARCALHAGPGTLRLSGG